MNEVNNENNQPESQQEVTNVQPQPEPVQSEQTVQPIQQESVQPEQTVQPIQQESQQSPEPNKKSNVLIVLIICITVVLIAAIVGVVVYLLNSNPKTNKPNDNKSKQTEKDTKKEPDKKVEPKEELKDYKDHNGKTVGIFADEEDSYVIYDYDVDTSNKDYKDYKKIGSVTCIGSKCKPVTYGLNYVLVDEYDETISLYDYNKNILVYNSKKNSTGNEEDDTCIGYNLLSDKKENIYGYTVGYLKNSKCYTDMYNINSKQYYTELEGLAGDVMMGQSFYVLNKQYVPLLLNFESENYEKYKTAIIDLTTGKKVSTLNGTINDVIEFSNKSYIVLSKTDDTDIVDINGNTIFKSAYNIYSESNKLVFKKNKKFYVYDSNLKLVKESKTYTDILKIGKDYVLVVDGTKLQLVDHNDKILTTFLTDYDDKKYDIHTMLSGWYTDQGKNGIYIVIGVDDKYITYDDIKDDNPDITKEDFETMDKGYEYYYIPNTKETGKIPTVIGGYAKPVLYLYPTKKTKVTVNFEHEDMLTTTYPKFNKEWVVTANTNGDLYDKDGNYYYALYWEENGNHRVDFSEGFYVEKENAIKFLEEKLNYIGLNKRERNEFIMYWLPVLEKNKKNLVYFELTKERDSYNKIKINPQPDSLLRIAIHIKKVNKKTNIKEQKLTKFNRTGFSAIEWGGVNY